MSDNIDYKAQGSNLEIHQDDETRKKLIKEFKEKQKLQRETWVDRLHLHQEVIQSFLNVHSPFLPINQYSLLKERQRLLKERQEKDEEALNNVRQKLEDKVEEEGDKTRELVETKGDEVKETVAGVGVKVDKLGADIEGLAEIIKTIEKAQVSRSSITGEGDIPAAITLDGKFASVASTAASTEATEEEIDETKYSKIKSTLGRFSTLNIPFGGRKNHGGAN